MDFPTGTPLVRVIQASPNLTFEGTRWTYTRGDAHWRWLDQAIDSGRALGAQWIIVTSHYPCLTVGTNGCPPNDDFYDLLIDKRVDLVLHGHEHSYARTHQLAAGTAGCPSVPTRTTNLGCVVDADSAFRAGAGTVFATVGTGGIALRDVNPTDSEAGYFAAWSGANSQPSHGLLDLSITADGLSASFVATTGSFTAFTIAAGSPSTTTTLPPVTTTSTTTTTAPPGATTTTTAATTTTSPQTPLIASDGFERSVAAGWGAADIGGMWTVSSAASFDVGSGAGRVSNPAGAGRQAHLRGASTTGADVRVTLSSDKLGTGSGLYLSIVPRSVAGGSEYRAVLRTRSDGRLSLRLDGGSTTISPEIIVGGVAAAPDRWLDVRVQAIGTNPTTVRAKVWEQGTPEPTNWIRSVNDTTSGLQQAGSVRFFTYLSSSATNGPIVTSIHDFAVTTP